MAISKVDGFTMTEEQIAAGRAMERAMKQRGQFAQSSFDAEAMAPKTWIRWVNNKGEEICVIECELQVGPSTTSAQGEGMVVLMCPKCPGESPGNLIVREGNKTLHLDFIERRKAPPWMRVHHDHHMRNDLGQQPSDEDKIPVVSSPERWMCDYCKGWCVRVSGGVAVTDMSGMTQLVVPQGTKIIGR
jgi:hypothetical protein